MQRIEIAGKQFNNWTVLKYVSNNKWLCRCKCGIEKSLYSNSLRKGTTRQCHSCAMLKHGLCASKEYGVWVAMRERCEKENNPAYHNYGGRGIKITKRWLKFENFIADIGRRPSAKHSLDRIDNDGNYEPKNCRWATKKEQVNNMRRNNKFLYKDKIYTNSELAKLLRKKPGVIYSGVKRCSKKYSDIKLLPKPN